MEVRFEANEVEVLQRVLAQFLSDLRMEIADTEDYDFRRGLKEDEEVIKAVLAKFGAPVANP